jgi:hypothetical protein
VGSARLGEVLVVTLPEWVPESFCIEPGLMHYNPKDKLAWAINKDYTITKPLGLLDSKF